jgi:hypothetical protein
MNSLQNFINHSSLQITITDNIIFNYMVLFTNLIGVSNITI